MIFLAARDHSRQELSRKLGARGFPSAEVDAVLVDGPVSGRGSGSFETWTTR